MLLDERVLQAATVVEVEEEPEVGKKRPPLIAIIAAAAAGLGLLWALLRK